METPNDILSFVKDVTISKETYEDYLRLRDLEVKNRLFIIFNDLTDQWNNFNPDENEHKPF